MAPVARIVALLALAATGSAPAPGAPLAHLALSGPFATRTPWTLVVSQDPRPPEEPLDDDEAGPITACLRHGDAPACDPALDGRLTVTGDGSGSSGPHYLRAARIVYRRAGDRDPLLLVAMASVHSGDGGQLVTTQALGYDRAADRFVRLFRFATGTNNNQDIRFLDAGPLRGDLVTVEPTMDAPFAYWVVVSAPTPAGPYRPVLRYRSATRYNDGNPLPVIDSEMPQIQRRLGSWRPGHALPLPAQPCPAPRLKAGALWCA